MTLTFTLNGRAVACEASAGEKLKSLLRRLGLFSLRDGCNGEGPCGLCAILLDGKLVNSCLVPALEVEGHVIVTVDHWRKDPSIALIQQALIESACVQCGYCTPAVTLAIRELLDRSPDPCDAEISDALSGTLCRCTGYRQFYDAVKLAVRWRAGGIQPVMSEDFRPDLRHVGKDRRKVDAEQLARGERAYVEDRVPADACTLKLLVSPYAHAWIRSIDTSAAEAMPGVIAVVSYSNCPDKVYTTAGQGFPEPSPYDQRMFGRKVRHVGDRVAAVLAESAEIAEAALQAIKVEYEVLQPVLTVEAAGAPGAPVIHSGEVRYIAGSPPEGSHTAGDGRDNPVIYQFPLHADPHRNLAASAADGIGDVDAGFAAADVVIERKYRANRVHCTPMEPHVVLARVDAGRLVIHASTQVPWHVRRIVAGIVGLPEHKVRVIKERVGGGFGAKQDIVVEDIASWMAWATGRTVYFRLTREEEFIASRTRHPMDIEVKMGAMRDGTLTAIKMKIDADTGPYGQHALTVPMNAISKSLPLLVCDNARFEVKAWYTNLSVSGAYQGYGAPQGSFALQTALAEMAEALGMDQLDLIEKNRVRSGTRIEILKSLGEGRPGAAVTLGHCGLGDMIARGRTAFAWNDGSGKGSGEVHGTVPHLPAPGPGWKLGRGAVIIQQGSGLPGLDAANAELRLLSDGSLLMLSGGADLGTGLDTVTAKTAAEIMGLDMADVSVVSGDTDVTPFDKGAYASSGTYFSGGAALRAAEDLRRKVFEAAAPLLGETPEDLHMEHHGMVVGRKGRISLAELGHRAVQGEGHGELSGFGSFKTDHAAFPYGAHFAEVAVNERTGEVKVRRYHAYQDCGTPINPALAKGQVYGAVLKSIGHALYEEMLYDSEGRCLNPRFLDYKIPGAAEVPPDFQVELMPVEDEVGPFGAKSVSEISVNGAAPAIAIAIHDATGAWVREWPFTPERVLRAQHRL